MKRVLALLFILSIGPVCAENNIIAVVNNSVITYNSLKTLLLNANSQDHKMDIINQRINNILQVEKAKELRIEASLNDVNLALVEISKSNNISIEQLQAYPEFLSLKDEVSEKISILNLQRYITKDVGITENEVVSFVEKHKAQFKAIDLSFFEWSVLEHYPSTKPYFLSGGIGIENLDQLQEFKTSAAATYCHAVDVNSKFEDAPAKKNKNNLEKFKHLL